MQNNLIAIYDSIISKQIYAEIQLCNENTLEYGLKLSDGDIKAIIKTRSEALSSNGRVEFGGGIIKKIIFVFRDSPYISQYNYVETINDLVETFYYYKNETMEKISDDELIDLMKRYFDNECQGSIEILRYKYLEGVANDIKFGVIDYLYIDNCEEVREEE
jgi:hypothetical protein